MKLTGIVFIASVLLSFSSATGMPGGSADDPNKMIVNALSAGNAKDLSVYLNSMVDLGISGNEGTYSKVQTTRILEDFFSKNAVESVKINRQGTSADGSFFSLGEMKAGGKHFRLYYLLKTVDGKNLIHMLQIQETK